MSTLDPSVARKIISHLKAGTTPIDCVEHLNVGNERWYAAAGELFDDIQKDGDSLVRFVNGYYGDGKTHFLGMLRSLAFNRKWIVTYVTAENTPLSKFDRVYSEMVQNMVLPPAIPVFPWLSGATPKGGAGLLGALFSTAYTQVCGAPDDSGLKNSRAIERLRQRSDQFLALPGLDEMVGKAVRGHFEAVLRKDAQRTREIATWLEGHDIRIREIGLSRRIDQVFARDAMRGISLIAKASGAAGILILLDEAERIMEQSRSVRNRSYGVIRDLLDNADNQGGMRSSVIYIAATPDTFQSEKGFAEYDALRSRLANAQRLSIKGFIDWRSVIVDLTKTPLPHTALMDLANRVREIHSVARGKNPQETLADPALQEIVSRIEKQVFQVSKPRMLASYMATILEIADQNPGSDILQVLDETLRQVQDVVAARPKSKDWE